MRSLHEGAVLPLLLRLLLGSLSVFLIELGPADGARVVLLDPGLDAAAVESVTARQLAACSTIGALLKADVAVGFFAFLLLWQVLNEVGRAALALRLLLLSCAGQEGAHEAVSCEHVLCHEVTLSSKEAFLLALVLVAEKLIHERISRGLRCVCRLASHVHACDLRLAAVRADSDRN